MTEAAVERILVSGGRARLRHMGFDDDEIDHWAETWIALEHAGDVEAFVAWVERIEVADGAA